MNKQTIHDTIRENKKTVDIPANDFINVYGDDKENKRHQNRADILAKTYNQTVTYDDDKKFYRFEVQ